MTSVKKRLEQIRAICRGYPNQLTALETLGRVYVLLDEEPSVAAKVLFLANHLQAKDMAKLNDAANVVFQAHDSFSAIEGFKLGTIAFPANQEAGAIAFDDRLVPGEFVKQLMRSRQAKERSA